MSTPETAAPVAVRVERRIKAAREHVFAAWTDPHQLARWFGPETTRVTDARVDLRPGGAYSLRIESGDGGVHTAVGTYRTIEPPALLSFTWDWLEDEHSLGTETLVTVELIERGEVTEVRLTHELLPGADAAKVHEEGWTSTLNELERHFA